MNSFGELSGSIGFAATHAMERVKQPLNGLRYLGVPAFNKSCAELFFAEGISLTSEPVEVNVNIGRASCRERV